MLFHEFKVFGINVYVSVEDMEKVVRSFKEFKEYASGFFVVGSGFLLTILLLALFGN